MIRISPTGTLTSDAVTRDDFVKQFHHFVKEKMLLEKTRAHLAPTPALTDRHRHREVAFHDVASWLERLVFLYGGF